MKDVGVWSLVTETGFEYMGQLYQQAKSAALTVAKAKTQYGRREAMEEAFRLAWQTVRGKQFPSTLYIMGMGL